MTHLRRWSLAVTIPLATMCFSGMASGIKQADQSAHSVSRHGEVAIADAVPQAVVSGRAHAVGRVRPSKSLILDFGLPLRHQARLDRFINAEAAHGHYLTKPEFQAEFAPTSKHAAKVESWARHRGLSVIATSPGNLVVSVRGNARQVERLMKVTIRRYVVDGHVRFANSVAPQLPAYLNVQTVTGLDNIRHAVDSNIQRASGRRHTIPDGGLTPDAIRTAYDMNGYTVNGATIDGTGQTVGITGFGETVPNSDFKDFADYVTGPQICAPALGSCPADADLLTWYQIDGKVTDDPLIDEQALDVEYIHGLAPHVKVKYWLGADGADPAMELAVADAAADPSLHVVSNSWGDPGEESASANNSFVRATQNSFKEAVATGTTFYFSTGDNAENSGCSDPNTDAITNCDTPTYPADSPYVVAVGGTDLQLNPSLTAWSSETVWNLTGGPLGYGSGGGCAPFFPRPSWQTGVGAASCEKGRAIPDISAAGDPDYSPINVWDGGAHIEVGGTSVSNILIAGMAIDTNSYITLEHGLDAAIPPAPPATSATCTQSPSFCWMGWAGPEFYKLATGADYDADFHDVLCGSNTWSAREGWDESTGWGAPDWYNMSRGFEGQSVTPISPQPSWFCTPYLGTSSNLRGVACNPAYHCHVSGQSGTLLSARDAWHWHGPSRSNANGTIGSITCPTTKVCYALAANGWVQKTADSGRTFVAVKVGIKSPAGIACVSATSCVAVGAGIATTSTGTRFATQTDPIATKLISVSCRSGFCAAVTNQGQIVESTNLKKWRLVSGATPPGGTLSSISCPAVRVCFAVGSASTPNGLGGDALVYATTNGTTWTPATLPGDEDPLTAVSCASATVCDAVGSGGLVVRTINGSGWAPITSVLPKVPFNSVTCPNAGLCFAVGTLGRLFEIGASPGH